MEHWQLVSAPSLPSSAGNSEVDALHATGHSKRIPDAALRKEIPDTHGLHPLSDMVTILRERWDLPEL